MRSVAWVSPFRLKILARFAPAGRENTYALRMLVKQRLAERDGFAVVDVRRGSAPGGWSEPETVSSYGVVFVRSGSFRRLSDGVESVVDPTSLYFEAPGRPERIRHSHEGDGRCTAIELAPELVEPLLHAALPPGAVPSPPFVDLEHRRLLALAHRAPAEIAPEQVMTFVASVVAQGVAVRHAPDNSRRRAVDAVRELLTADPRLGLLALARHVALSPYHLSRIFAAETGQTISNYRNCLRARAALERIGEGERSLARMAADLGFADHAHLTRVVRREAGAPPSTLRELLRFGA
jgi:AraC-like DNA-binding protein